jgi:hypothetical protein
MNGFFLFVYESKQLFAPMVSGNKQEEESGKKKSTGGGAVGPFFFSAHFAFSSSSVLHIVAPAAAENRRIPHQIVVVVATEGFSPCGMFSSMYPMHLSLDNSPRFFSCTSEPLTFSFFGPRCVFLRFQQFLYRDVCFSLFPTLPSPDTRFVSSHALTQTSHNSPVPVQNPLHLL